MPAPSPRTSDIVEDPFGLTPNLEFPEDNEFDDFLSDVSHTVQEQVEAWKEQLARAILRWEPEGYRTARLADAMNDAEVGAPVERIVAQFASDVSRLREMQEAIREVAPTRANDPVFYDPDRVADAERLVQAAVRELGPLPGPSEAFSVEAFVEAESNKVAVTAVHAAVEEPGRRYNPLVFIGTPGVGKTHLLHVTAHGLATREGLAVACLSSQQFIEELGQAIDAGAVEGLRSRFGHVGALLLDDLQLLGGDPGAQEEFFYIFNRLYEAGSQLVFTLNVSPAEVRGLDERIVSRLEGGLVTTIDAPDRELRRAVIVHKLEEQYGAAELDLVDYLAARPAASIRAVQGLVQRVVSTAEARGVEPNGTLARELIEGAQPAPTAVNAEGIQTSGVWTPLSGIRSEEKVVWRWPDPVERMIEELG